MQKYEKKLGNIMFIDDRVSKKKADPDNIFEGVPAKDGYKIPISDEYPLVGLNAYVGGDYESYTDEPADVTDDYYNLSNTGRTITFFGTTYAGHKFYDQDGNLIWATNARTVRIPDSILKQGWENITIMTATTMIIMKQKNTTIITTTMMTKKKLNTTNTYGSLSATQKSSAQKSPQRSAKKMQQTPQLTTQTLQHTQPASMLSMQNTPQL